MKKIISSLLAVTVLLLFSCHSKLIPTQSLHTEITDKKGNKILLGSWPKESLLQEPYATWFVKNYNDYKLDTATCEQLKSKLTGKGFTIFMGTWCGDSKREVPRVFRILDYCGVSPKSINLIMLSNDDSVYKQSPAHQERGMNIHRVPDFIVTENKKELGRIIESPVLSLEKDLLAITSNQDYIPNYKSVAVLITFLEKNEALLLDKKITDAENLIKPFSKSANELNTYGYVKMAANEMDKAEIAFRVNAILYPDNANVFDSLGDFYAKSGYVILARASYSKALQLEPANDNTRKKMARL
jgi:tetratricopeptide (TPR) repeat protein